MNIRIIMTSCLAAILTFATLALASSADVSSTLANANPLAGVGSIDFPNSGLLQAKPWFLHGVFLLHNFEYDDAREAFRQAQALDESFAMAYWGEAMTANHPLWNEQDVDEGRAALHRLAPNPDMRLANAPTKWEQGYLRAINALYGEGNKPTRDKAYLDLMRKLTEDFPDKQEASAFYALAILGSAQGEREMATYMKAAAIAEEIFHKNPTHPGAAHYLIHAYDDPIHAPLGLRAARVYASLAPLASHAQHMPSHIFMPLGMWDEVITANEAAWASSEARITRKGLSVLTRPYHTLKWLMYAYLQVGRVQGAKQLLTLIETDAKTASSLYTNGYLASMRAIYIVETEEWDIRHINHDRSGLEFSFAASELFALGMSAVNTDNLAIAKQMLAQMSERIQPSQAAAFSRNEGAALAMMKELEALILLQESKPEKALSVMKEAAVLEDSLPYDYGPPIPIKPTHELLGEVFMKLGQPEMAKKEFKQALQHAPKRTLSLRGYHATQ